MLKIAMNAGLAIALCTLTACGGSSSNQFLKNVSVSTSGQNGDTFVNLAADVNLGNVSMDDVLIPVYNPKTNVQIGEVKAQYVNGNENVTLGVNLSAYTDADPLLGESLPNGKPLPAALGAPAGVISGMPVGSNGRVYLGIDSAKNIYVGYALGIKALDGIGNSIGQANIFYMNNFGKVFGIGGLYTSLNAGQSGLAVLARYSPGKVSAQAVSDHNADFQVEKISKRAMRKLQNFFYGEPRSIEFSK